MIVRKAFGGGYAVIGSKALGADLCFAWPTAEIGVMGANSGVDMQFHRDLARAEDPKTLRQEFAQRVADHPQMSVALAEEQNGLVLTVELNRARRELVVGHDGPCHLSFVIGHLSLVLIE